MFTTRLASSEYNKLLDGVAFLLASFQGLLPLPSQLQFLALLILPLFAFPPLFSWPLLSLCVLFLAASLKSKIEDLLR